VNFLIGRVAVALLCTTAAHVDTRKVHPGVGVSSESPRGISSSGAVSDGEDETGVVTPRSALGRGVGIRAF